MHVIIACVLVIWFTNNSNKLQCVWIFTAQSGKGHRTRDDCIRDMFLANNFDEIQVPIKVSCRNTFYSLKIPINKMMFRHIGQVFLSLVKEDILDTTTCTLM